MDSIHSDNSKPLRGVKVLEIGQMLAGPFAGVILADLGADVLKIEKPGTGDDARSMGIPHKGGPALVFRAYNRGKRSLCLDLKDAADYAKFLVALEDADILLHNVRPDTVRQLGMSSEALTAQFPRLIYCELSSFGMTGPKALDPGFEPLVQAFSGLSSINGHPDRPGVRTGPSICDLGTGMWLVIGALAALRNREVTGRGSVISTALLETALVWAGSAVDAWTNQARMPARYGSGQPNLVPYQTFEAQDGAIMIAAGNDRLFAKLATALGLEALVQDPRYSTNGARLQNRGDLVAQVGAVVVTRTVGEWMAALHPLGIPCSPVNTIPQAVEEEQVKELGIIQQMPNSDLNLLGLPLLFDGTRPSFESASPNLGDANTTAALGNYWKHE